MTEKEYADTSGLPGRAASLLTG